MNAAAPFLIGIAALAGTGILRLRKQARRRARFAGMARRLAALRDDLELPDRARAKVGRAPRHSFHFLPRSLTVALARVDVVLNLRTLSPVVAGVIAAGVGGFAVAGPLAALAAAAAIMGGCGLAVHVLAARRMRQFIDALPELLDSMRQLVVAGQSLPQALTRGIDGASPIVQCYLRPLERRLVNGASLPDSLTWSAERLDCRELFMFSVAVRTQTTFGGRMSQILANFAGMLRDGARVRRELSASTSETRISAYAIALAPPVAVIPIGYMNPDYLPFFFTTEQGRQLGLIALAFEVVGLIVCRSLMRLDF